MIRHLILFLLAALFPQALADVEFMIPQPGAILRIGDVLTAQWRESSRHPLISDLLYYDLYLCAGGQVAGTYVGLLSLHIVYVSIGSLLTIADAAGRCSSAFER